LEKERFLFMANHATSLTAEETSELESVQREFPYCQAVHVLAARGAQLNSLENAKQMLNLGAVYATDRSVLKEVLSAPRAERADQGEIRENEDLVVESPVRVPGRENLAAEVMQDLFRLKELRKAFEVSVSEYQRGIPHVPTHQEPIAQHHKNETKAQIGETAPRAAIVETPVAELNEDEPQSDALLEEIKGKKKLKPESTKQREQIEIINQFIKKQPTIVRASQQPEGSTDLAEKSISLTDNIVSETLVEILLRQGKKEKAIEVLKKLIWKFPQKKSIFAAQIEELKK
jgi:hypothetical protein